jgi:hypothetical protein
MSLQSDRSLGFYAKNWSTEMPFALAIAPHVSRLTSFDVATGTLQSTWFSVSRLADAIVDNKRRKRMVAIFAMES